MGQRTRDIFNSCKVDLFQVRDSWRLSTGEKAEVGLNLTCVPIFSFSEFSSLSLKLFEVEDLIETEQRRRRRESLEEEDEGQLGGSSGQLGGGRNNLEEEARELTRLKQQVESKVSKRIFGTIKWTSNSKLSMFAKRWGSSPTLWRRRRRDWPGGCRISGSNP